MNTESKSTNNISKDFEYGTKEELMNGLTHALGVVAGVSALFMMVAKGLSQLTSVQLFGVIIYGVSIILLFLASTLYHSSKTLVWRKRLKMVDHCAIYLLIAGTYTPLMLISLEGTQANIILTSIWLLAFGGCIFKTLFIGKFQAFSVGLYLVMGWLCMTVITDLMKSMSDLGFYLLLIGGAFYSLGVIFYVSKRIPYNHAIWHLFVLGGAFSHFLCIYLTVI